ncbi:hypothetical protein E2C01_068453 [Portunus trituberculatus]|uniref:Uncharacterized protein n=1 Tax=Portunus trituberculatus TaxID=210409 RepID=A0A5B7HXX6_PORTR|nr:hypothetical protein [Portunus trituberculatus]
MSELMNEIFKSVFNEEGDFMKPNNQMTQEELRKVVHKHKVSKLLENLDIRKAMGHDGVSGWTLRECREQMVAPIWHVINSSPPPLPCHRLMKPRYCPEVGFTRPHSTQAEVLSKLGFLEGSRGQGLNQ